MSSNDQHAGTCRHAALALRTTEGWPPARLLGHLLAFAANVQPAPWHALASVLFRPAWPVAGPVFSRPKFLLPARPRAAQWPRVARTGPMGHFNEKSRPGSVFPDNSLNCQLGASRGGQCAIPTTCSGREGITPLAIAHGCDARNLQ